MRKKLLVVDLVILEEYCNGNCDYCLTKDSTLKNKHIRLGSNGFNYDIGEQLYYCPGSLLYKKLNELVNKINEYIESPIIKVSGGEIFLIPGIINFIEKLSKTFFRVQVLTNGTLIEESDVKTISEMKNVYMQISLDGWSSVSNEARIHGNTDLHNRIINTIILFAKYNVPLEINCVLHNRNIKYLIETIEALNKLNAVLTFLPYPLRGTACKTYQIMSDQLTVIDELIYRYEEFKTILPPLLYINELKKFYDNNMKRSEKCVLPNYLCQLFDDALLVACVNMWTLKMGMITETDGENLIQQIGNDRVNKLLTRDKPALYCKKCFTPWEVINFYFTKRIQIDEITSMPLYKGMEKYFKELALNTGEDV